MSSHLIYDNKYYSDLHKQCFYVNTTLPLRKYPINVLFYYKAHYNNLKYTPEKQFDDFAYKIDIYENKFNILNIFCLYEIKCIYNVIITNY